MIIKGKEQTKRWTQISLKLHGEEKNHITMCLKVISPRRYMREELDAGPAH